MATKNTNDYVRERWGIGKNQTWGIRKNKDGKDGRWGIDPFEIQAELFEIEEKLLAIGGEMAYLNRLFDEMLRQSSAHRLGEQNG